MNHQNIAFFLVYALLVARGVMDKNMLVTLLPSLILVGYVWRYAFFRKGKLYIGKVANPYDFAVYGLFIGALVLSMIRTGFPNATAVGITNDILLLLLINFSIYLLTSAFFRERSTSEAIQRSMWVAILSPGLLILLLVTTYIVSYDSLPTVEGDFRSEPLFLNLFGMNLSTKEIVFRQGLGRIHPNTFGIYSGALFVPVVLALIYMNISRKVRRVLWLLMAALLLSIFITDSRITVLNSLFTPLLVIALVRMKKLGFLPYLPFLIPLLPFLSLLILENIADWELISMFSKNANDIASGSARATIWKHCFDKLTDMEIIHLIGYGEYGHYLSGTSLLYDTLFNPNEDFSLMVTHNVFFQAFFDTGYIGVILYIAMLFTLIKCTLYLYHRGQSYAIALLGFMLYYTFSGVFESAFGMYNRIYTYIFVTMSVVILVLKNEYVKRHSSPQEYSSIPDLYTHESV